MTVGVAVVGGGLIGREHLARLAAEPRCRAVALVEPAPWGAALARRFGCAHHETLDALLARTLPDAAIVATPNALHVPQVLALVARGVPVLVEKPVADSVPAARELCQAVACARVPVLVGHHRRHGAALQAAQRCVAQGLLGNLVAVTACTLLAKPAAYFEAAWRRSAPAGGPLLINAVHDVDSLRALAGEVVAVQACQSARQRGFEVEDTAVVLLEFASGVLGTLMVSDCVVAPHSWELTSAENPAYPHQDSVDSLHLHGTRGTLALPTMRLWTQQAAPSWTEPLQVTTLPPEFVDPLARQLAHFCDVVERGAAPCVDVVNATNTLAATLAIREAAAGGGRTVLIPHP